MCRKMKVVNEMMIDDMMNHFELSLTCKRQRDNDSLEEELILELTSLM